MAVIHNENGKIRQSIVSPNDCKVELLSLFRQDIAVCRAGGSLGGRAGNGGEVGRDLPSLAARVVDLDVQSAVSLLDQLKCDWRYPVEFRV